MEAVVGPKGLKTGPCLGNQIHLGRLRQKARLRWLPLVKSRTVGQAGRAQVAAVEVTCTLAWRSLTLRCHWEHRASFACPSKDS